MRQGVGKGIIAIFAAVLVMAPGALGATPADIYNDLADNGRIDGTYTQAEWAAFLQSASVQGYGNPVITVTPPTYPCVPPADVQPGQTLPAGQKLCETPAVTATTVVESNTVVVPTPAVVAAPVVIPAAGGVAGTTKTIVKAKPAAKSAAKPAAAVKGVATPAQAPLAQVASAETLPFTGAELGIFALVGTALLLGGLLLRASARKH